MKIRNTILFGILAIAGFTSCEMKEELWGEKTNPDEVGLLNVGVAVTSLVNDIPVATRANTEDIPTSSPISAEGYKIDLLNADGTTAKSFTYKSDMEPVEVPTGDYTLYAHMDKTFDDEMTEPYYGGRESISIKKGITTEASVTCKMENTKIQINYPDTFLQTFETWTILITDNKGHTVTFTQENKNPNAIYWRIGEDVKSITVNVTATTKTGDRVSDSRNILKPTESESEYWLGNDALTITVVPGEKKPVDNPDQPAEPEDPDTPDNPEDPDPTPDPDPDPTPDPDPDDNSTVSGIEIKVEGIFGDTADDVTVEVPTTPGDEDDTTDDNDDTQNPEPEEPDAPSTGNTLKMELPGTDNMVTFSMGGNIPTDATVEITADKGIQSLVVKIVSGNKEFAKTIDDLKESLNFVDGVDIVGHPTISAVLNAFLNGETVNAPAKGDTEYSFPVGAFFNLMQAYGSTAPGYHSFQIILSDGDNEIKETLKVQINPAQ